MHDRMHADSQISQRMEPPVLKAIVHRRRSSTPWGRLGAITILLLSFMLLSDGHAFAREQSLRDELEAWWKHSHTGTKAADKTCVTSEAGCTKRKIVRRRGAKATAADAAEAGGHVGRARRVSLGRAVLPAAQAKGGVDTMMHSGTQRRRAAKRGRDVAANSRGEARDAEGADLEMSPRRDRPGRYFLHGPRF